MLSGDFSLLIPGVKGAMDKLDAMKAKFLAVPSNVRAALDRLGRIRMMVSKSAPVTLEFSEVSQIVETNLKSTQIQWETAAERFSQLDSLRQTKGLNVSGDTLMLASQLLTSAGYVMKNADTNIAAVNKLAEKFLTTEQRTQLAIQTTGIAPSTFSLPLLAALGVGAFLFMRRR